MKRHVLTIFSLIYSFSALPETFETVILTKDKSISTLIFGKGIGPIYGKKGYLSRVLKLNNLTEAQARKLPVGTEVRFPIEEILSGAEENKSTSPELVAEDSPSEPFLSSLEQTLRARAGFYFYQGDGSTSGDFTSDGPMLHFDYAAKVNVKGPVEFQLNPYLEVFKFREVKEEYLYNYGLDALINHQFESFAVGVGARYSSLFYVYVTPTDVKATQVNVPGAFLRLKKYFETFSGEIEGGMNFSSNKDSKDVKSSPLVKLLLQKDFEKVSGEIFFSHERREIDSLEQDLSVLGVGVSRSF